MSCLNQYQFGGGGGGGGGGIHFNCKLFALPVEQPLGSQT